MKKFLVLFILILPFTPIFIGCEQEEDKYIQVGGVYIEFLFDENKIWAQNQNDAYIIAEFWHWNGAPIGEAFCRIRLAPVGNILGLDDRSKEAYFSHGEEVLIVVSKYDVSWEDFWDWDSWEYKEELGRKVVRL